MKHLILDAGGVLVWPRLGQWHIPFRAAELLGPDRAAAMDTDRFREVHAAAMRWLREDRIVDSIDTERLLRRGFVMELDRGMGWHMTDGEIDRMADDFTDNPDRYGVFDDACPYLSGWKRRYGLALLSDAMPSLCRMLPGWGLDLFDRAVISTHVGVTKPHPRMYETVLEALDAAPAECLFVDDNPANVAGAERLGIRGVQMSRPEFPASSLWNGPVVHSFGELDKLLKEGAL